MNTTEKGNGSKYKKAGFYQTPDLSQRLDLISHLLANTELIPYVQAAEGCGKTRLSYHLEEILSERYTVFRIDGETGISAKELRSALSRATGAADYEVIDDEQLSAQINALNDKGKALLILVDDADQLPAESLTLVTGIAVDGADKFICKCVLFATVDVLALPMSPVSLSTLNDNIQTLDIPHITPEQLPGFVASVEPLKSAVIDEAQYAALMKNSAGVIGKILWQLQYIDNSSLPQQQISTSEPKRLKPVYVVLGILFVSALVSVLIFQDEINQNISENASVDEQKEPLEVIELPLPPPVVSVDISDESATTETATSQLRQPEPGLDQQKLKAPESDPEPPVKSGPEMHTEAEKQPETPTQSVELVASDETLPSKQLAEESVAPVQEPGQAAVQAAVQAQEPAPLKQPGKQPGKSESTATLVAAPATKVIEDSRISEKPKTSMSVAEVSNKNANTVPGPVSGTTEPKTIKEANKEVNKQPVKQAAKAVAKPAVKARINIYPVEWMLKQSDKAYTLQLLAVSEKEGIKRFIERHDFKGNFVILQTKRKNKPWFALLYGSYGTRDEALNARKLLPKSYKSSSAWPRSILSIRQAISAN